MSCTFFGCSDGMDKHGTYQNIEGVWEKKNVCLVFSNATWECLLALDNMPPLFNSDEDYAFPDRFNSYDDYINATKNPSLYYTCKGNGGHFEISNNYITLYDDDINYKLEYKINDGKLILMAKNNNMLRIFYDKSLYRPFNPELRATNDDDIFYDLNGVWNKL
jgi:hypothetical protein